MVTWLKAFSPFDTSFKAYIFCLIPSPDITQCLEDAAIKYGPLIRTQRQHILAILI